VVIRLFFTEWHATLPDMKTSCPWREATSH